MDMSYYQKMEPIFGEWKIKHLIGEGNFGKVFEIEREDFGEKYTAALKVITIPQNASEIKSVMSDGMDEKSATTYYRGVVKEIVDEFALMSKLKGHSNIVSYEDHRVIEHQNEIGWDILIRMELLTPLIDHIAEKGMTHKDIVQLGIDLCKALEFCQRKNIVHRDIKPENIFISENGDYKLGDFGIARTAEKTTSGLSKKGTYTYMAPEVYLGQAYGPSVDMYSLGLVLYRLLNNNRAPFLPAYPNPISYSDREVANSKRINGEDMPAPVNADAKLAAVVLKACAHHSAERFESPEEMRLQLEQILGDQDDKTVCCGGTAPVQPANRASETTEIVFGSVRTSDAAAEQPAPFVEVEKTESAFSDRSRAVPEEKPIAKKEKASKKKKGSLIAGIVAGVVVVAIAGGGFLLLSGKGGETKAPSDESSAVSSEGAVSEEEIEWEELSVGDTFNSLLWGTYAIDDYKKDEQGKLTGSKDYTNFLNGMKFEDVDFYDYGELSKYNVSVVPYEIAAMGISDEEKELFRLAFVEKFGEEQGAVEYENFLDSIEGLDAIEFSYRDQEGTYWRQTYVYEVKKNKLKYGLAYFDEAECKFVIAPKKDWLECKFKFNGRNLVLERKGLSVELVPADFSAYSIQGGYGQNLYGYVAFDAAAYRDIAHMSLYATRSSAYIDFTDGMSPVDPVAEFSGDNTVTISWQERYEMYNGSRRKVADPTIITANYISCDNENDGFILIVDGKYYAYQSTEEEYMENKLGGNLEVDTEDLEKDDLEELNQRQGQILNGLNQAFTDAGIAVKIDEVSGEVTLDSAILFAVDDAALSANGTAYLDGVLDVYKSVILNDTFKGYISKILIEGHTDTSGTYEHNVDLSERRAASVVAHCLSKHLDLSGMIEARGCSWDNPVYDENGNVDMAASRRVTFKFILNTENL